MSEPLYTPPRLRITCAYQTVSSGSAETVEIELNDPGVQITSQFVGDLVCRLVQEDRSPEITLSAPSRTAAEIAGHSITYPPAGTFTTGPVFNADTIRSTENGGQQ